MNHLSPLWNSLIFSFLLQMRKHWAHVFWARRGSYAKDSSQAFISIWVTVLSPQWPAPGTCHRGLWDYLSIKLRWPLRPSLFFGLTMQVLANSLHPIPPYLTPSFHTKMISLYVPAGAHRFPVSACMLHVNHKSHVLYSMSAWMDYCSVAHSATGCPCESLLSWATTPSEDFQSEGY